MTTSILDLNEIAALALQRHAVALQRQPRRGAPAYLRAALRCARQMGNMSKRQPALLSQGLAVLEQVAIVAQDTEQRIFASGGNSAAYLSVMVAATTAHLALLARTPTQPQAPAAPASTASSVKVAAQITGLRPPRPAPATSRPATKPLPRPPRYHKFSAVRLVS